MIFVTKSVTQSSSLRSMSVSSTSKISTEFPGILGGAPEAPYPNSGGITSFRFSPTHILKGIHKLKHNLFKNVSNQGLLKDGQESFSKIYKLFFRRYMPKPH